MTSVSNVEKSIAQKSKSVSSLYEIIDRVENQFKLYGIPNENLYLFAIDSLGGGKFILDFISNNDYTGARYDAVNRQYIFNISRYAQLVATKKQSNYGFYLRVGTTYRIANRTVLLGGNNIQFNLSYTKLKQ